MSIKEQGWELGSKTRTRVANVDIMGLATRLRLGRMLTSDLTWDLRLGELRLAQVLTSFTVLRQGLS